MERIIIVLLLVAVLGLSVYVLHLNGQYSWLKGQYDNLLQRYKDLNAKYEDMAKRAENAENQANTYSQQIQQLQQQIQSLQQEKQQLESELNVYKSQSSGISWTDWDRLNKAYNELSSKLYKLEQSYKKVLKAWCSIMDNMTIYCHYYPEDPDCQKYASSGQVSVLVGLLPAECSPPYYP
ncbi:hypothetical protein [Candidatus Methanodesulfokora washburnensis]|jgi:uncharacterized protein involved in exopolysaccharide biosynthesis|uniref:Uncharacterized protein n=1 Tax=Candidatus Methanodesulfokora washburnensis TaxID=2478471 RepID=A0A3R9QZW1_9CREN|nr:hypothetical protein [Candidatus Methanodesulfokores washburnensis]RSN76000.1 hypothetical protein D6D85_05050 [Candidatus Methanodesulfokores washburnensis]